MVWFSSASFVCFLLLDQIVSSSTSCWLVVCVALPKQAAEAAGGDSKSQKGELLLALPIESETWVSPRRKKSLANRCRHCCTWTCLPTTPNSGTSYGRSRAVRKRSLSCCHQGRRDSFAMIALRISPLSLHKPWRNCVKLWKRPTTFTLIRLLIVCVC
jgi:hypothetical protein